MKRVFVLVALIVGSGLFAVSREVQPAFACSGPGPIENMLESTVIFEGRVTAVTASGPPGFDLSPRRLTFEVIRAHKGTKDGATIVANAVIPVPGVPTMCPQFPQDLAGKYVVIGLQPDPKKPGELFTYAWVSYVGASLSGPEYDQMARLARMIADSDPAAPQITLSPAIAKCGQPLSISGRRFPAGSYLLRYSGGARAIAVVEPRAGGVFDVTTTMAHDACRNPNWNGRPFAIHVSDVSAGPGSAWTNFEALVEIGVGTLDGGVESDWPSLIVTPNPARCGDTLEVRGRSFAPGERVLVALWERGDGVLATADSVGALEVAVPLPPEACNGEQIRVSARQAGFEAYTSPYASLAEVWVNSVAAPRSIPGPPEVGTGPARLSARDTRWLDTGWAVVAAAVFGAAVFALRCRIAR